MIIALVVIGLFCAAGSSCAQTQNEIFEKLIGREARLDPAMISKVLASEAGSKHYVDSNGDGRVDVMYMIDTDERHSEKYKPILVKVVDEDGDMYLSRQGDLDSDLWVADWNADGTIDRAVDYNDLDHDNDVDEQYLFQWSESRSWKPKLSKEYPKRGYMVVWAKDYGDDNRLWFHINYEYGQRQTQWLTDFNGDEMFVYVFYYDYEENKLISILENAFAFYDPDGDEYSEEVVRFSGTGPIAETLRYSMDIDNDSRGSNDRDYDFSVSCWGPVDFPQDKCQRVEIRGHQTELIIRWERMRQVAKAGRWINAHLTWDENDSNVDPVKGRVHHERWEGIISHGNEYIRQIGGPSCGPYNKRNEIDTDYSGMMQFYYSPVDHRLHLYGAEVGWIKVDYDYDETIDMIIWMEDENKNGFFDTWKYDVNGDSLFEYSHSINDDRSTLLPLDYQVLYDVYNAYLSEDIHTNQRLTDVLKAVLRKEEASFTEDAIELYFRSGLVSYEPLFHLGEKIRNSPEGTRYYQDVIRERYWHRLMKTPVAGKEYWNEISGKYEQGDFGSAAGLLKKMYLKKPVEEWYGSHKKRFTIEIVNDDDRYLENHPLVLNIPEIKQAVRDFNPLNYVIVEAEPRIDYRIIPSQIDDSNEDTVPDELVFVYSLLPVSTVKLHCYYSPTGSSSVTYLSKADTRRDWSSAKANIGWESNWCGYRMYYGQMDFFGKRLEGLRYKSFEEAGYHGITDWGMDVIHVGASSGIGGITIWDGTDPVPVMNPIGEGTIVIDRKILSSGPVRSLVRARFTNIRSESKEYEVTLIMSAFADNRFSQQEIIITAAGSDSVVFSPGMQKLQNDRWFINTESGMFASWGFAGEEIGEIGLGLMFPPENYAGFNENNLDRFVKLKIPAGKRCKHYIIGNWRKALPAPFAPSAADWAQNVKVLSLQLYTPVHVHFYQE